MQSKKFKRSAVKLCCLFSLLTTSVVVTSCAETSSTKSNTIVEQKQNIISSVPNPLVKEAKELQTGSENIGIDHLKAIELLKKASDAGDAEAMYLLSDYYLGARNNYLPKNLKIREDLLFKSAQLGNWDAMNQLMLEDRVLNAFSLTSQNKDKFETFKPIINEGIRNKIPQAFITMSDFLETPNQRDFTQEQCKLFYDAYQLGDVEMAGYRLKSCDNDILKKLNAPSSEEFANKYAQYIEKKLKEYKKINNPTLQQNLQIMNNGPLENTELQNIVRKRIKQFYINQGEQGYSDAYIQLISDTNTTDQEKKVWYEKAAKLNNSIALTQLGSEYLYPENEKQKPNVQLGVQYLEKASAANNADAMNYLVVWYNNSQKLQDQEKAKQLSIQAAQLGSIDAMNNAALILDEPENYKWATIAFKNGSKNDDVLAMAAKAYAEGIGVPQDQKMAKQAQSNIEQTENNDESENK